MASRFTGRTALVTGAASGIGLEAARLLAHEGAARLILCDRDGDALAGAAQALVHASVESFVGDVADEAYWNRVAPALASLDCAVINAGIATSGLITQIGFADWRRTLAVNLDGAFLGLRAAMRAMAGRGGSIVATASVAGLKAEAGASAYGTSKAALIHLVKVAAKEGAVDRIRINAIAPGGVETPVWQGMDFFTDLIREKGGEAAAFAEMARLNPLGRYAAAGEIAEQIAFLLSDACAYTTGSIFVSDGGYTL